MTPGKARELLGVDEKVSADALRRAYLRRIKQHPPERDPEGFRALREAYECLSRWLPAEPRRADGEPERASIAQALSTAPADRHAATDEEPHPATDPERVEAPDPVAPLRDAWQAIADAEQLANALFQRGDYEEATEVICEAVSAGAAPAARWLTAFFRLIEFEEIELARRLLGAIQQATDDRGEAARLHASAKLRLVLASELSAVARELPDHLAQAIAAGLATSTPHTIDEALAQYARDFPTRARTAREILDRDAPHLAQRFGPHLATAERRGVGGSPVWVGMALILGLLRLVGYLVGRDDPHIGERITRERVRRIEEAVEIRPSEGEPMLCLGERRACRFLSDATEALDAGHCYDALRALDRFDEEAPGDDAQHWRAVIGDRATTQCLAREVPGAAEVPREAEVDPMEHP